MANMYAMVLARHRLYPDVKYKGLYHCPQLTAFVSEDAHYSVSKAANWMGLGMDNVIKVKTNKNGQMITSELVNCINESRAQEKVPFIVISTAGTTVLGAFDHFDEISEVCLKENIWHHCDAAWGGSFIFSERLRAQYLKGIEKCDSILWNAHKMLGAPLQCSAFFTRESDLLAECNSLTASYLFQQDKFYSVEYDRSGDKSFQCGRKADAFKFWFMWVALGTEGIKKLIENTEDCARYFAEKISSREDFLLYLDGHQCTNVFCWYIPLRMRTKERDASWWEEIGKITTKIKEKMVLNGSMMIGYSPLPHKNVPNAITLVLPANPIKTHAQMDFIIDNIEKLGKDL